MDFLRDDESLIKDETPLCYDYIPKPIKYREGQQQEISYAIKPLLNGRDGGNLFVYGSPGVGKTLAVKYLFREIEFEGDNIIPIYINCWKKDTSHRIALEICKAIGYKWTHNKGTDELLKSILEILNKRSTVICLDEVDKTKDLDILYNLCEDLNNKTIILVTNYADWIGDLDDRIKSRLIPGVLEFKPYDANSTRGILKERKNFAFVPGVLNDEAFDLVARKTCELKDIRSGLFLLKKAADEAERKSSREIKLEHAKLAIEKFSSEFKIKNAKEFGDEENSLIEIIKENSGTIKELYGIYIKKGGNKSYRTFYRKIDELLENHMIEADEKDGKARIISYGRKLTDF